MDTGFRNFIARSCCVLGLLVSTTVPALAQSAVSVAESKGQYSLSPVVQRWFQALTTVDRREFNKLLAEDAKIELRDLGITQTKAEFIEALDNWEDATKGAILLTRPLTSIGGKDVIETCYRFEENEQLNRETYISSQEVITSVIQELIGDKCVGF